VVKLIYSDLNLRFVVFMTNYFSMKCNINIDSDVFLVTEFVNLKIKLAQSFKYVHKNKVCVRVLIELSNHTYMSICVSMVFKKNRTSDITRTLRILHTDFVREHWCINYCQYS
jgi:hypothetical protein